MFLKEDGKPEELVAWGSYLGADPDRVLVKRIVLTGYPVGVHKRSAVVKRMFYNADDIRWFKPVELWTKYGLVGHIKEPRGTKGYLKATFDGFIKNHDTVCMSLYKRQFPPWDPTRFP
jgi:pre-rRNA-processing protein TSR1